MTAGAAPFLPYGRHVIDSDDVAAVIAALNSGALTGGDAVTDFERTLADKVGARHAVACNSGTAALHLAAHALGLGSGDAVIVPAVTFLATANAALYVGAKPIFADVDPQTGLMMPHHVEAALARADGARVRAVFPVHLCGQVGDPHGLAELARQHGLAVVEDACHAIGTTYGDYRVGDCGHSAMACFSFHPVKTIAMGEGGAVTTNDDALAKTMQVFRNHGMTRQAAEFLRPSQAFDASGHANPWYYEAHGLGFNFRASDINCALGTSQLGKLDRFVDRRRTLVATYDRRLAALAPKIRPLQRTSGVAPGWHLYVVLMDFAAIGLERAEIMNRLKERGIGTQVHYLPLTCQPHFQALGPQPDLPGSNGYYQRCLSLPLSHGMSDGDVERVCDALHAVLQP